MRSESSLHFLMRITLLIVLYGRPVHSTLFSSHKAQVPQILTSSDDGSLRTFDLATAAPLSTFWNHDDYVRTSSFVPSSPDLYLSGSYDTTVKLWDARTSENGSETMSLNHGYPVEAVLVHPSGTTAISAGGPVIKIWDLLMPRQKPLKTLSNHQKTITSLSWGDKQHSRLLSAGLDGLVKSYNIQDGQWRVGHTMRFGGQLLSLALSPAESTLCVGAADGTLSIRSQPPTTPQDQQSRRVKAAREGPPPEPTGAQVSKEKSVEFTWRSASGPTRKRAPKLKEWDRLLKVFRYADALDCAMERSKEPRVIVAVLDELKHLDGLQQALGARNDRDLIRILRFMNRQISDPRWGMKVSEYVAVILGESFFLQLVRELGS